MSVRARLFLLLLALSVLPVVFLRVNGHFAVKRLTEDLIHSAQRTLVAKAKAQMLMMVEDHAELWRREGLILEQTLRLQTILVENALAGPGDEAREQAVQEAYRTSAALPGHDIPAQLTVFTDGRSMASREMKLPRRFDGREAAWYRLALSENGPVWTAPVIDPVTRRIGVTLSCPVRDGAGAVTGVTALMAPLSIGGMSQSHTASLSRRLRTYLVAYDHPEAPAKGLRVIGSADPEAEQPGTGHGHGRRMGMLGQVETTWLSPDDHAEIAIILAGLSKGESAVRQAELQGKDFIWAYAPVGVKGIALVLAAPKSDVAADADAMSAYILSTVRSQMGNTLILSISAVLVVTAVAWRMSRSVTRPISELAGAWRRLAGGDFGARVTPSGGGEITELGRSFNEMVPELQERTRLKQSLELAREVHRSLLPAVLPQPPGLDMAGASVSCEEAGGDSFDVIPGARGEPGRVAALVGDVSGHGLDAALLMATARAFLRVSALGQGTPAQAVTEANRFLAMDTVGTGRFMTLFYLELDPARRGLTYVRAGHDPAFLYRAAPDSFEELGGPGIPLGVLEDKRFEERSVPWPHPGDVLLVGSDGLWEARRPDGEMFGKDRVRDVLRNNASLGSEGILGALFAALEAFKEGEPSEDDVTLLVIKFTATETA